MFTTESCTRCERIVISAKLKKEVVSPKELPNTFDEASNRYGWKYQDFLGYALIPREFKGRSAVIDLYVCIEEDDQDDIDLVGFFSKYLQQSVFPKWGTVKNFSLTQIAQSVPDNVPCRKLRHVTQESES